MRDALAAREELTGHRHYRYRGCAPVPPEVADFPGQALGDPSLPVSAWDRPEDEAQQQAAATACAACPVLAACKTAALTAPAGKNAIGLEPVRGGLIGRLLPEARRLLNAPGADAEGARQRLVEHPRYRYRGCAISPDPEFPGQSLGAQGLPVDAWATADVTEGEPQWSREIRTAREGAAIAACAVCPVLAECQAYAMSVTPGGRLTEPAGIWGGVRALDRHRALIRRRQEEGATPKAAALAEARSDQKQAVLMALARETDEELVAYRAGMDLRSANWHRAILCTLLGLDKDQASREQLLRAARRLGVLDARVRIRPDGRWPIAAAPNGDGSRQRRIAPGMPQQIILPGYKDMPRGRRQSAMPGSVLTATRRARRGPRLRLVQPAPVQLPLPIATTVLEPAA